MQDYEIAKAAAQHHFADLLFRVGTQAATSLDSRLQNLANVLIMDWERASDAIIRALLACATELSDKSSIYATLVALVNVDSPEIGAAIVERIHFHFVQLMEQGSWRKLKLMLRFVAELGVVNVVEGVAFVKLIKSLLAVLDEITARDERKDAYVDLVVSCLPWAAPMVRNVDNVEFQRIVQRIDDYINTGRLKRIEASLLCRVFKDGCSYDQEDSLALKWKQIKNCAENDWQSILINRPFESFSEIIEKSEPRAFGDIRVASDAPNVTYPAPQAHFELFREGFVTSRGSVVPQLPATETAERFLLYDMLDDLLFFFHENHEMLIKYLLEGMSVSDAVLDAFSLHQALVEVVVSNIFRLPNGEHKSIYYIRLLVELCRKSHEKIPPIFGKSIYTLYEHLHEMDEECQGKFSSWFAIHLSNFQFKWNWMAWVDQLKSEVETSQTLFLRETFEKCQRLSYYEHLLEVFPKEVTTSRLFVLKPEYVYKYDANGLYGTEEQQILFAGRVLEAFRLKTSLENIQPLIDEIKEYASAIPDATAKDLEGEQPGTALARDIVAQTVLFLGSKSFSHILLATERNLQLLLSLTQSNEAKIQLICIAAEFWRNNKQFLLITLDKLINYKIIDSTSVVNWIFKHCQADFTRLYVWDLIKLTGVKLSNRIELINKKLQKSKQSSDMEIDQQQQQTKGQEEHLSTLQREQKQFFILVYQQFVSILKAKEDTLEFNWKLGMFISFGRQFHREMQAFSTTLDMIVFSQANDDLRALFTKLQAFHA